MFPEIPPDLKWLAPWERLDGTGDGLVEEIHREIAPEHVLAGVPVNAIARRQDCDDVLFVTSDPAKPLALVHLAWHGREATPEWPWTVIFKNWQEWIDCVLIPCHEEFVKDNRGHC
jgi:hypothetical protein